MSSYFYINLILTILSTFYLGFIYKTARYLFLKPSMILLVYTHLFFQWNLVFASNELATWLPEPFLMSLLVNLYVLIGLVVSANFAKKSAYTIYWRINYLKSNHDQILQFVLNRLIILALVLVAVFLMCVPFKQTALYMMLTNPAAINAARSKLTHMQGSFAMYLFSLTSAAALPFLSGIVAMRMRTAIMTRKLRIILWCCLPLLICFFYGSLVGQRSGIGFIILTMVISIWIKNNMPIKFQYFIFGIILLLVPALLMSIMREGRSISDVNLIFTYFGLMMRRAFVVPFTVGSWYVHYAQTHEPIGLMAFKKLAEINNLSYVDAAKVMGKAYGASFEHVDDSSNMNANGGYLFSYYCYFGIYSLLVSLLFLWLLDIAIFVFTYVHAALLVPAMAALFLAVIKFVSSDYTVVWVTHGYGMIILLTVFLNYLINLKFKPTQASYKLSIIN